MPDPIEPTPTADATELETLRRVHAEILTKRQRDKARVAELEAKATELESTVQELILNRPLKQMAASLSTSPDTLIESLLKDYKVKVQGDGLVLETLDDKPVMQDGKPVPFEREALIKLLLSTKDQSKLTLYNSILIASRASGAAQVVNGKHTNDAPKRASSPFGFGKSFSK